MSDDAARKAAARALFAEHYPSTPVYDVQMQRICLRLADAAIAAYERAKAAIVNDAQAIEPREILVGTAEEVANAWSCSWKGATEGMSLAQLLDAFAARARAEEREWCAQFCVDHGHYTAQALAAAIRVISRERK